MQIIIQEHLKSEVKKMQYQCKNDWQCGYQNALNDVLHIIDELTPIELPSDEEIKSYSDRYSSMHEDVSDKLGKYIVSAIHIDGANWMKEQLYDGVRLKRFIKDEGEQINGAKWMKEQILNQNK